MFRNISSTFVTKILVAFINLLIAVLISNWLGAEGKGIQGLFFTTCVLSITFLSILGLMPITYLYSIKPSLNYYLIVYVWSFCSSFIVYYGLQYVQILEEYILYITITSFLSSLVSNNLSIFIIKQRIVYYNIAIFSQSLSLIILMFSFYFSAGFFTIEHYIQSFLFSHIVQLLFSLKGVFILIQENIRVHMSSILKDLRSMFRYGFFHQLSGIIQLLCLRSTYYILNHYSNIADVGIYSNAISISESIWIIAKSLSVVFYSKMINTNKEQHEHIFSMFLNASFWLQIIGLSILIILPGSFYVHLFGADFEQLKSLILLLLPASLLFGQTLIIEFYFASIGKHHINVIVSALGLIVILAISFLTIPQFSSKGAAIATNSGFIVMVVVYYFYMRKHIGYSVILNMVSLNFLINAISKYKRLF